jgi:ribose 1,5-bisphosphokinase
MTQRLIYVIGPSGAGKDSVLHGLRRNWAGTVPVYWARRTITRVAQAGGEMNECVSASEFERLSSAGTFAMEWQANGLSYGIRRTELDPLSTGHCVFVNGSRAYLPRVLKHWPASTVVQITAPAEVLHQRLRARNRESVQAISDRLARGVDVELPGDAIRIVNDGPLEESVDMLLAVLQSRFATDSACQR